jgi:hypothetical protein
MWLTRPAPESPHDASASASKLAALEGEVAQLRNRVAALEAASGLLPTQSATRPSSFKPVSPAACQNSVPCLHTNARERLASGCSHALWVGQWLIDPLSNASLLAGNGALEQRFHAAADDQCEPAHAFLLSPEPRIRGHVTDANERHASSRLRGVRSKLWLLIGSSVDHQIVRDVCVDFRAQRLDVEAPPTALHPLPGLRIDYCTFPSPLGLKVAYIGYKGLTALEVQSNASLQAQRFGEISSLLRATKALGTTPDFVSFGGIEWDFKQWGLQKMQPHSAADWAAIRNALALQLAAARQAWPRLHGLFLRSQFRTTYRWYRDWVDVAGEEYERYNGLMRGLAAASTAAPPAQTLGGSAEASTREPGGAAAGSACGAVHVLDIARAFNCTNERGYHSCGRESGWTVDGLHPSPWAMRAYFSTAVNVLADVGEACSGSASGGDRQH